MRIRRFLGELWATFFDNGTSKRDFRAQLRGARAMWVWCGYLVVLTFITAMAYGDMGSSNVSISTAQQSLKSLYGTILTAIGALMLLIVPAMTATSVNAERERRSLDLLQSAPVSPTYLLIGKLMHAMRFGLILAALTAPFAGIAIMAGGAVWQEVIAHLFMILFSVSFYAAIALAISGQVHRTGLSLLLTFATIGALTALAFALQQSAFTPRYVYTGHGSTPWSSSYYYYPSGSPFWIVNPFASGVGAANPWFMNPFFAGTTIQELDLYRPDVQRALIVQLVLGAALIFLILMGSASSMSRIGSTETKVFRIIGLLCCVVVAGPLSAALFASVSGPGSASFADLLTGAMLIPSVLLPFSSTWRTEGERKTLWDGWFNFRKLLVGTPSSGVPLTLLAYLLTTGVVFFLDPSSAPKDHLVMLRFGWGLGHILFVAGVCGVCSMIAATIGNARGLAVVALIVSAVAPLMLMAYYRTSSFSSIGLYGGIATRNGSEVTASAVLQTLVGLTLLYFSNHAAKSRVSKSAVKHAQPTRAA